MFGLDSFHNHLFLVIFFVFINHFDDLLGRHEDFFDGSHERVVEIALLFRRDEALFNKGAEHFLESVEVKDIDRVQALVESHPVECEENLQLIWL